MPKIKPTPVDERYINKELKKLFDSFKEGEVTPLLVKYKSRFNKEKEEIKKSHSFFVQPKRKETLSLGKKLEILCLYGNHTISKRKKE